MIDEATTNPLVPSDEGDKKGLELGRAQGEALTRTLRHMTEEIAHDGREVQSGEYLVAYAVEEAEGMYVPKNDKLEWAEPDDENAHIEIAVRDAADGRLVPCLKVEATVIDREGNEIGTHEMPLLWHPYLYHYGRNWTLPADGRYTLKVRFDAPTFARHDEKNGHRFLKGAEVTFNDVKVKRGQD